MFFLSMLKKLKAKIMNNKMVERRRCSGNNNCRNRDIIHINIDDVDMYMERCMAYDKPHEITAVIPRAELRKKVTRKNQTVEETEIILNSITIVSSPQRPSHAEIADKQIIKK